MSFDDSFMMGLMLGGDGGGGGGDEEEEWHIPENWINIPEPEDNQIVILIEIPETGINIPVLAITPADYTAVSGVENVDWGDGYTDFMLTGNSVSYTHFYSSPGLYIITINGSDNMSGISLLRGVSSAYASGEMFPDPQIIDGRGRTSNNSYIRAIKFGNGTYSVLSLNGSGELSGLVYVKYCGNSFELVSNKVDLHDSCGALCRVDIDVLPTKLPASMCRDCVSLKDADFTKNVEELSTSIFNNCYSLKRVDLSSLVTLDATTFYQCFTLKEINAPKLEAISNNLFFKTYRLQKFTAPLLTELPANTFSGTSSLVEINTPSMMNVAKTALSGCYSLQKFIYAEGCNFNGNTFEGCPALYPKPQ